MLLVLELLMVLASGMLICTTDQSLDATVSFESLQFRAFLWKQLVLTEMVSVCKK